MDYNRNPVWKATCAPSFNNWRFYDLLRLSPAFFEGKIKKNALFCHEIKKKIKKFGSFIKKP